MIDKISNFNILDQAISKQNKVHKVPTFSDTLKQYISSVNNDQVAANNAIVKFLKGENKDIHSTVISVEKAEISLQLMLQIKNKLTQAYQEIMRMQI